VASQITDNFVNPNQQPEEALMKLYYSPGACSLSPHIVARETDTPIELVRVDTKTHKTETGQDYYAINPRGYVPALQLDDGTLLREGPALVQYLADRAPASGLAPAAGTMERVHLQEWLTFIGTEIHKQFSWLFMPNSPEEAKQIVREKLANRFTEIDKHLSTREYLLGGRFTVADAYLFTVSNWANFVKMDLAPYPNLKAFMGRVAARPKVQEALRAEGLLKN
jgi:glutathione S-transferase